MHGAFMSALVATSSLVVSADVARGVFPISFAAHSPVYPCHADCGSDGAPQGLHPMMAVKAHHKHTEELMSVDDIIGEGEVHNLVGRA